MNDILPLVDWDLVFWNWKPFIGYSDATNFQLAMYAKIDKMSFSGPMFTNFGELREFDYTMESFRRCMFEDGPYMIEASGTWNDDNWPKNQENRMPIPNPGYVVINPGQGEGVLLGNNLGTMMLNAVSGEDFMPSLHGSVLFLEDDNECGSATLSMFVRRLEALTQRPDFVGVRGIVIGRFMKLKDEDDHSGVTDQEIVDFVRERPALANIPILANANIGHTKVYPLSRQ